MPDTPGEFENLVLLAILQLADDAFAATVRERIETGAERSVSRGALYATLDRLGRKGWVEWEVEETTPERGGIPRRRFRVTTEGVDAVRSAHAAQRALTRGLEHLLGEA